MRLKGQAARRSAIVLLAAVLTAALTARLGFWQLDRAAQKNALHASMQEQRARPPLNAASLARDVAAAQLQQHRAVVLEGQWLAQHTVYLDNRQMNARVGFFALTPLALDDGTAVLVQRGWLPRDQTDRSRITATPAPPGRVRVQGRIALEPSRLYEFEGAALGPIRQNIGLESFAREASLPLRPVTVVQEDGADSSLPAASSGLSMPSAFPAPLSASTSASTSASASTSSSDGLLRQWAAPTLGVHKHYGYAFQWFSLSVLTMGLTVWFQFLRPRRAAKAGRPGGDRSQVRPERTGTAAP